MSSSYKLGILGGLGPLATIDLIKRITDFTKAEKDQDHIPMLILSNPTIPDRTESICNNAVSPYPMLLNSIQEIDKISVEFVLIPCNTAHYYINELQQQTNTKIINMVEETVKYIHSFLNTKRVIVLGTDGLIKGKVYDEYLSKYDIINQTIRLENQKEIMLIIRNIKANGVIDKYKKRMHSTLKEFDPKQESCYILACTELSLLKEFLSAKGWRIVDAMDILAIQAIKSVNYDVNRTRIQNNDTKFRGNLYEFANT